MESTSTTAAEVTVQHASVHSDMKEEEEDIVQTIKSPCIELRFKSQERIALEIPWSLFFSPFLPFFSFLFSLSFPFFLSMPKLLSLFFF